MVVTLPCRPCIPAFFPLRLRPAANPFQTKNAGCPLRTSIQPSGLSSAACSARILARSMTPLTARGDYPFHLIQLPKHPGGLVISSRTTSMPPWSQRPGGTEQKLPPAPHSLRATEYCGSTNVADVPSAGAPHGLFPPTTSAGPISGTRSARPERPLHWLPIGDLEPTLRSSPKKAEERATAPSIVPVAPPSRRGRAWTAAASIPNLPHSAYRFGRSYRFQLFNP